MLVCCVRNSLSHFTEDELETPLKTHFKVRDVVPKSSSENSGLALNEFYAIQAIKNFKEGSFYYTGNFGDSCPYHWSSLLFDVSWPHRSRFWSSRPIGEAYIESFAEWQDEGLFFDKLVDGEERERRIYSHYARLVELESPRPNISEWAQAVGARWVMCKICTEAWEPDHRLALTICPKCATWLNNPEWDDHALYPETQHWGET